jgi:hypothetical protein
MDHGGAGDRSEPRSTFGNVAAATGGRGGIGSSHTAYKIRKQNRIWTAVHKGSDYATDQQTDLSRCVNDDVIVTDVQRRGEKVTRVINMYDQRVVRFRERHMRNIYWSRII